MLKHWVSTLAAAVAGMVLVAGAASQAAATMVLIQETIVGGGVPAASILNNFYNGQPGITSSLLGDGALITPANLSGIDLFVGHVPSNPYAPSEIAALAGLLSGGGRILFIGENGAGIFQPSNNAISAAIAALGGSMFSDNITYDPGFHNATRNNGQVLAHALTENVNTINYAAPSGVGGIDGGDPLLLTTNLVTAFAGVQLAGGGSIVALLDSNLLSNLTALGNDNDQFFLNLATVELQRVPEPAALLLLGSGLAMLGGLGWRWSRRK